ncbi:hypothetical protein [Caulobacter sp. S45]|uniref:hypothetical protein n=1 Tax=Caulobacter sp. S45 TaxID=1641861 RepID=UPI0035304801
MHSHSGIATLTWQPGSDVKYQDTDCALAFGWVDGLPGRVDARFGPAMATSVAVWAGALSNYQGHQHRLAAAVLMTLVVLVIVGGSVYFRQRGFKKPYSKHQL